MEDILRFIEESTPGKVDRSKVQEKLSDLGVTCMDDMEVLDFEVDTPGLFNIVQARRLKKAVADKVAPKPVSLPPPTTPTTVLANSSPSSSSSHHHHHNLLTPTRLSQLNFKSMIEVFPASLKVKLASKERATPTEKNDMVKAVCNLIFNASHSPGKAFLEEFCADLIREYPDTFEDRLSDGTPIGKGHALLLRKCQTKIANIKREHKLALKRSGQEAELDSDEEDEPSRKRKGSKKDRYGCVNFLPRALNDGETTGSQEEKKVFMKEQHYKIENERDEDMIAEHMLSTYVSQRRMIAKNVSLEAIKAEWPFLFKTKFILAHFKELMGFDLLERMDRKINENIQDIIDFLKTKVSQGSSEKSREAKCLTQLREDLISMRGVDLNEKQKFVRVVRALANFWKQDTDALFKQYDETTSLDEIEGNNGELFCHPHVAMLGEFADTVHCLPVAEGTCLTGGKQEDVYTAVMVTFAAYYVFSIAYPPKLAGILEFIQRLFAKINGEGSKVKRTNGAPSDVNTRVLTLQSGLEEYRRMWGNA